VGFAASRADHARSSLSVSTSERRHAPQHLGPGRRSPRRAHPTGGLPRRATDGTHLLRRRRSGSAITSPLRGSASRSWAGRSGRRGPPGDHSRTVGRVWALVNRYDPFRSSSVRPLQPDRCAHVPERQSERVDCQRPPTTKPTSFRRRPNRHACNGRDQLTRRRGSSVERPVCSASLRIRGSGRVVGVAVRPRAVR